MDRNHNIEIPPKDEEELELEKLVFGDFENFEINLKRTNFLDSDVEDEDEANSEFYDSNDETESSEGDEDLFFIDDGNNDNEESLDMDVDEDGDGKSRKRSHEEEEESEHDDESEDEESDDEIAWEDSDDEEVKISLKSADRLKKLRKLETDDFVSGKSYIHRLRSQFEKIYPKPTWVNKLKEDDETHKEEDDEDIYDGEEGTTKVSTGNTNALLKILNSTDKFIVTKQLKLISPNKISIVRLKDANQTKRSKSGIQSLSFHKSQPLLLTGGFDRTLRIYHIDGRLNNLVTSLHLKDSPIYSCHFLPLVTKDNKNLIYASGRRRYMNRWDLNTGEVEKISRMYGHEKFQKSMEYFKISPKGNYIGMVGSSGYCNILNGLTGQFLTCFKIEGTIIDFEISNDEKVIIIINTMGEVWEFDFDTSESNTTSNNRLIARWQDESGVGITKLKLGGPKNQWLAIGTNNGIVNIYDRTYSNRTSGTNIRKPMKTVENLITTISCLQFSPDGQLLVIASRGKRDALRLVHLPSGSVYLNWPTSGTPLGKVTAVTFLPNNQLLAIGNEAGKVTLWRLTHY